MTNTDSPELLQRLNDIGAMELRNLLFQEPRPVLEALSKHPKGFERLRDTGASKFEADFVKTLLDIGTEESKHLARQFADLLLSRCKGSIIGGSVAFVVGVGAVTAIIWLAKKNSLPNPFSFSLLLYVLPLGILFGPLIAGGYLFDALKIKRILKTYAEKHEAGR